MQEIFKNITEFPNYQVSNTGRVKSLKFGKELIMKLNRSPQGYFIIALRKNNKYVMKNVHQLVAMAFLNHTPCGHKLVVDHINEVRGDNRVENLQIITHRENIIRGIKNTSSKHTGVSWDKTQKKWQSYIIINNKKINLGFFTDELEASK